MICRSCGTANPPDSATCRVCGRPPSADPAVAVGQSGDHVPPPKVLRPPPERPKPAAPPTSNLAIAALVAGVVAWVIAPLVGAVIAIVCGHLALRDIEASSGAVEGRGLAIAGLILGYAQVAVAALTLLGICVFFAVTYLLIQSAAIAS
ncbi:MAG: hypothetical protein KatS3mg060_1408 [Dehalococcoidia bacterium]|nr:MAG: hypothetical protein KatS3mg060_1408 [Dehalococcoidia bacterium]